MKKLLNKFTNDHAVDFFNKMYQSELIDEHFLSHKVMIDLKTLCNHVADLRRLKKSNAHILNFRRNVISCLVSSFDIHQLRSTG